jgi:hypothetical protein
VIITSELFKAFIQCPTKGFLLAQGTPPTGNIYADWMRREAESYRTAHSARLAVRYAAFGLPGPPLGLGAVSADWRLALDVYARSQNLESGIHAIERIHRIRKASLTSWFQSDSFLRIDQAISTN